MNTAGEMIPALISGIHARHNSPYEQTERPISGPDHPGARFPGVIKKHRHVQSSGARAVSSSGRRTGTGIVVANGAIDSVSAAGYSANESFQREVFHKTWHDLAFEKNRQMTSRKAKFFHRLFQRDRKQLVADGGFFQAVTQATHSLKEKRKIARAERILLEPAPSPGSELGGVVSKTTLTSKQDRMSLRSGKVRL